MECEENYLLENNQCIAYEVFNYCLNFYRFYLTYGKYYCEECVEGYVPTFLTYECVPVENILNYCNDFCAGKDTEECKSNCTHSA